MAEEWIAPLITGVVGACTVSTTIWLAHRSLRIQAEQAAEKERRLVYSRFLRATQEMSDCAERLLVQPSDTEGMATFRKARSEAAGILDEIRIVGSDAVQQAAEAHLILMLGGDIGRSTDSLAKSKARLIDQIRQELKWR
ncbi:hypothetical protein ACFFWC_25940 [Plantactinospora siamensis]|uniref:Uncharacterized protein n=1 Tax=Plantactinospora siamensis TaxID=555372 RepID=A0ABV6P6R1_9ACTN